MSDKYETELKRFIYRSLEHLRHRGKDGMCLTIEGSVKDTDKRFKAIIKIKIEENENEEEQH